MVKSASGFRSGESQSTRRFGQHPAYPAAIPGAAPSDQRREQRHNQRPVGSPLTSQYRTVNRIGQPCRITRLAASRNGPGGPGSEGVQLHELPNRSPRAGQTSAFGSGMTVLTDAEEQGEWAPNLSHESQLARPDQTQLPSAPPGGESDALCFAVGQPTDSHAWTVTASTSAATGLTRSSAQTSMTTAVPSDNRAKKSGACRRLPPAEDHVNQNGCEETETTPGSKSSNITWSRWSHDS